MKPVVQPAEFERHRGRPAYGVEMRLLQSKHTFERLALIGGIAAPLILFAAIIFVGAITPHYDPFRQTISQMGTPDSRYADLLNGGYFVYGLLIGFAAIGFRYAFRSDRRAGLFAALMGLHALGTVLLGVFPDAPEVLAINESKFNAHNVVSAVAYLPLIGGGLVFYLMNAKSEALRAVSIFGLVVIAVNMPMPVITLIQSIEPVTGFLQRLFYGVTCSWLAVASWQVLSLSNPVKVKVREIIPGLR